MDKDFKISEDGFYGTILKEYTGFEKEIVIPEGVEIISKEVFKNKGLTKVTFPKSLKEIRIQAFAHNELTEITFQSPVQISTEAFAHNKIEKVNGPINSCDGSTFYDNPILNQEDFVIIGNILLGYNGNKKEIVIPEGVEIISREALKNKGLTKVTFPKSLKKINYEAFANNELTEVTFQNPVQIDSKAFAHNKIEKESGSTADLTPWSFENNPIMDKEGLIIIGNMLLGYNGNEKEIEIPEGVEIISERALENKGLTKVTFPKSLKKIGTEAFANNELIEVTFTNPVQISTKAFAHNKIEKVNGPINSCDGSTFYDNPILNQEDFVIIGNILLGYNGNKKEIDIPEGVEIISGEALENKGLTKVTFPKSLKKIGVEAFANNELTEVTFQSSVQIDSEAFTHNKIEKINGPIAELTPWSFENNPIMDKEGLIIIGNMLLGYNGNEKEIEIPEGVEIISGRALENKGLTKVTFPKSLKKIGVESFANNELTEITFTNPVKLNYISFAHNKIEKVNGPIASFTYGSFENNPIMDKEDLVIIGNILIGYNGNEKEIVIPEGVEIIKSYALNNKGLTEVTFPTSLKKIEANALANNDLYDIIFKSKCEIESPNFDLAEIKRKKVTLEVQFLKDNSELKAILEELENILINNDLDPTIYDQFFAITKECKEKQKNYKPTYNNSEVSGYTIVENIMEAKIKLIKLKEKIEERLNLIKTIKEANNIIHALETYPEDIPSNIEYIIKYLKIIEDENLKREIIEDLQTVIKEAEDRLKESNMINMVNNSNLENKLLSILIKYELISKTNYKQVYPYYEQYSSLCNEIETLLKNNDLDQDIELEYIDIIREYKENTSKKTLVIISNIIDNLTNAQNKLINLKVKMKIIIETNKIIHALETYPEDIPSSIKYIIEYLKITEDEEFKKEIIEKLKTIQAKAKAEKMTLEQLSTIIMEYEKTAINKYNQIYPYYELYLSLDSNQNLKDEKLLEEKQTAITEVIKEIYSLLKTESLNEEEKLEIVKEISEIMNKWKAIIKQNHFLPSNENTYINNIDIPGTKKYEMEIAKDLYGIVFKLNSYLNNLSYYEKLTK